MPRCGPQTNILTDLSIFSLGPLVCKVKDHQVEFIVDTLCNNMIGDNEQLRDISSIGLKTVINELPLTTQTLAATGLFLLFYIFIRVTCKNCVNLKRRMRRIGQKIIVKVIKTAQKE